MIIQIVYSLRDTDKDYSELYDFIKSIGEAYQHLDCSWWVYTPNNVNIDELVKQIYPLFDSGDLFQIIDITNSYTNGILNKPSWKWLKEKQLNHDI